MTAAVAQADLPTLGSDPGKGSGAAALVRDRVVLAWWAWQWMTGKHPRYRISASHRGPTHAWTPVRKWPEDPVIYQCDVRFLLEVGEVIAAAGPCRLVLEGLYAPSGNTKKAKAQRQHALVCATAAGEVLAGLRPQVVGDVHRPLATTWRTELLGLPSQMTAQQAEAHAVTWARRLVWEAPLPRWGLTIAEEGAVCEAVCMGVWGEEHGS